MNIALHVLSGHIVAIKSFNKSCSARPITSPTTPKEASKVLVSTPYTSRIAKIAKKIITTFTILSIKLIIVFFFPSLILLDLFHPF